VNRWYKDNPWLTHSLCSGRSGRIQIFAQVRFVYTHALVCISGAWCWPPTPSRPLVAYIGWTLLTVYVHTRDSSLNPNYNTLDPDCLQCDHHTPYVVTQKYSHFSATLISFCFHSHNEFGVLFSKMLLLKFVFYFLLIV
jgi:hypothetical protein